MVFEKRTERRENRAQEINATPEIEDISVFPMAIPMIAGPGSIASIMLLMAQSNGIEESFIVLGALAAILLLTMIRSEEHTSELQSLMRISYAVFCLKKKTTQKNLT